MNNPEGLSKTNQLLQNLAVKIEKLQIAEYIELLNNPRKFLLINFISGIVRGLGMAIGFILLGAVMIWLLSKLAVLNIPVIGDYVTEIVKIVQEQL